MNPCSLLSLDDLERLDRAAKSLLEDPGVKIEDEDVARRLLASGAKPGRQSSVLRLPHQMVEEFLARAPRSFPLADRSGIRWKVSPDSASLFWTGASLFYLDPLGFRPIRRQDLADFARVVDSLQQVHGIVGTSVEEALPSHRDFIGFRTMAENTSKHLRALSFSTKGGEALVEMGKVLAGPEGLERNPIFSVGFTAHGPLRWTSLALGLFKVTAGHRIPCTVNGEPMSGASAPVTLAGTVALGTAEILSGIVINQVLEPGRPCFFNLGFAHVMDMRGGFAVTGGPENALLAVAGAELARYYGLPSVSWMCTDSLQYDGQNALEKTLGAVTHTQARVSLIWGVGTVESQKALSPVQAVIDDEILSMTRKFLQGFDVNDDSILLDEIRRVGITGSFLDSKHTLDHFRGAIFEPHLLTRMQRSQAGPRDTLVRRAEDRVREILDAERRPILSPEQSRELVRIEETYKAII